MDPMKSRRWIAAATLAAAAVFLVMVTGERGPADPAATPAPVSSSESVRATDGGPAADDGEEGADRAEIIDALQGLLDALGISADELGASCPGADGAGKDDANGKDNGDANGNGDAKANGDANGNDNGGAAQPPGSDDAEGSDCEQSEPASAEPGDDETITIAGFAFGEPLTVAPGTTIKVVNTDAAPHNVTAADGSFETPDLNKGDTANITAPTTPGRYEFTCTLHPEMTGTLLVEGEGDRGGDQGREGSSESSTDSKGSGSSGGDHKGNGQGHEKTAPSRGTPNGSSDGY
jgi:plastocyanin